MSSIRTNPEWPSVLDRPNSYIGKTVPRPNLDRLLQGRGCYVSDIELPRMAHVVFLRSPHAHAKIVRIDAAAATTTQVQWIKPLPAPTRWSRPISSSVATPA